MNQVPEFYDPGRVGTLFYPDMAQITTAAENAGISSAGLDEQLVHLVIIDMQIDFCHETGSLYVPGAPDDIRRLIDFIFQHGRFISKITCTLDTHLPFQIFHPSWWVGADGNPPDPLTIITVEDVEAGKWRPVAMADYSIGYVHRLEDEAKKQLTIWPYHVLMGNVGNALDPALWSAVMWHSVARKTQPTWMVKGMVPQTEHYSAIRPEIPVEDHPQGSKNQAFLDNLAQADLVIVAGEAESHCVLETLEDIVAEFQDGRDQLEKIYVLQDCMSSVQHPDIDFHALAQEQFAGMAEAGIHFIDSVNPDPLIKRW